MRAAKELANKEGPNRSLTATTNTTAPEVPGEPGLGEKPTYASKVGDTGFLKAEGKAETMAGKVLGCMGMVKDGEEKSRSAAVLERTGDPDGRVGK